MVQSEYVQIDDEQEVYSATKRLTDICTEVVTKTSNVKLMIKDKYIAFTEAKKLSRGLLEDIKLLNEYMKPRIPIQPKQRPTKRPARKIVKKVRSKPVSKINTKESMKKLRANIKKIKTKK